MPLYDRRCEGCDWQAIDVFEPVHVGVKPCPACGDPTVRAWLTKPAAVVGDEMDHWQFNGTKEPIHFRSKIERARWMKANNLRECVRHVTADGTDKSKHTTRWATMDQYTLDNARELLERAAQQPARNEPKVDKLNVRTTYGEVRFHGGKRELVPNV